MSRKTRTGELFVAGGFLNEKQLQECLDIVAKTGNRLGEVVVEKGYMSEDDLYHVLSNHHKVPFVDLYGLEVPDGISKIIPAELARKNVFVPVKIERNVLYIAIEDPKNFMVLEEARIASRMEIQPLLASVQSINYFLDQVYGDESVRLALSDYRSEYKLEDVAKEVQNNISSDNVEGAPIVRLVNTILEQAVSLRASDIHIEPMLKEVRVRMRVDGMMTVVTTMPLNTLSAIVTRIKILGNLNIAERRVPQDGRFNITLDGREIDIRLSTILTVNGEKVVMRLLDRSNFLISKEKLGFTAENLKKFDDMLSVPHGVILVAGPTGSGKSTTLYAMLEDINEIHDNIITVEDPVEYILEGLNQMQINPKVGVDFANGLRAILRQDPDVIMVGEIRDAETVNIAIRAAITGHLVLSTIHTNDAVSSVLRLSDMGVPNYMIAASLVGVISQRLVRMICTSCKKAYDPTLKELETAGISRSEAENIIFYKGAGCRDCSMIGYKGRTAIHEVLVFDHEFRAMVHENRSVDEMRKYAIKNGMKTIKESAMEMLQKGVTTLDEIAEVVHGL